MSKTIKDYTRPRKNGPGSVELKIEEWSVGLVAYSFNDCDSEFVDLLAEALEEFGTLTHTTGVSGATMNRFIQSEVRSGLEEKFGDRLIVEGDNDVCYNSYKYTLKH